MKTCIKCNQEKSLTYFRSATAKKCVDCSDQSFRTIIPVLAEEATCPTCGETKSADQFDKDSTRRNGLSSRCKPCKAEYNKQRRAADPEIALREQALKIHRDTMKLGSWQAGDDMIIKRDLSTCGYCGSVAERSAIEIDHIIPVVRGGKHKVENLTTACTDCNGEKRDMSLSEFKVRQLLLGRLWQPNSFVLDLFDKSEDELVDMHIKFSMTEFNEHISQIMDVLREKNKNKLPRQSTPKPKKKMKFSEREMKESLLSRTRILLTFAAQAGRVADVELYEARIAELEEELSA